MESTNHINGFYEHIPPPKLIGNPEMARSVLMAGQEIYAMADKPKMKPRSRNSARVQYYACRDDVDALLDQGYNPKRVYERARSGDV